MPTTKLETKALWHAKDLRSLGLRYQARHFQRFRNHEYQVSVKGVGKLFLRPRTADAAVVSQVFSWLQYDTLQFPQHCRVVASYQGILARGKRPLILDLGANNGVSARWFAREYPDADIVAVEPDSDNARICRLNTEGYSVEVISAAIGSTAGQVSLDNRDVGSVSYTTTRSDKGSVPVVTVGQIVDDRRKDHELFIVKIDIEGFEEDLFATNTEWVEQAQVIMIEPHDWKFPDRSTSRNLQKTMARLPFQMLLLGENIIYVREA